jgi:membrane protein
MMLVKRVFLFFALAASCICLANAKQATCGSGRGVGAPFNFEYSYNENSSKQKQATFNAINCPQLSPRVADKYDVVLDNIDFKSGTYVCQYNIKESKSQEEIQSDAKNLGVTVSNVVMQQSGFRIPYSFAECVNDDLKFINEQKNNISTITAATINDGSAEARYIGSSRTKLSEIQKGFFYDTKTSVISELVVDYSGLYKILKDLEAKKDDYSVKPIVFQTNKSGNDTTISEFIVGALTLNEDVFKSSNAIDQASGKANFQDNAIITKDTEEKFKMSEALGFVAEWIGISIDQENVKIVSPLDKIMDGKLWGFYISFIENIRKAEREIVLFLFFIGFCIYASPKVIQFGFNHFGDNDSRQDIGWKKMMIAPATAAIFFLAPVIPTNLTINGSYLHTRTDNDVGIVLNSGSRTTGGANNSDEKLDSTTLIQTAIQYFVKQGTLMANKFADYALYPYLIYLQSVNNMSVGNVVDSYAEKLDETRRNFLILQKEVEFYSAFCKTIYGAESNTAYDGIIMPEALSGTLKTEREALTQKSYDIAIGKTTLKPNNNITTISVDACAALEQSISKISSNTIADYYFTKTAISSLKDIKNAKTSTQTMHNVSQRMANMQVTNGWINTVLVPSSFTLYKTSLLGQTLEERKDAAVAYQNAASVNNNSITTNSPSDDVKAQEAKNDTRGFSKQNLIEALTPSTLYFMLPKFTDLYNGIDKFFGGFVDILMTICTTLLVTTTGAMGILLSKVLGVAVSIGKAFLVYTTSVFLYNWLLEIITFSAIALMIIYRIAFYFIEVLTFFIASPAVVIWAVISKRFDAIMHYIGRGAVLSITPILIVLSTYLYIFGQEILNMIYALIVGIIQTTFVTPDATVGQTITVLAFVSMGDAIMKAVYVIMGFVCIIKFNSWFYQMIGIKEGAMADMAQTITDKTSSLYSPIR